MFEVHSIKKKEMSNLKCLSRIESENWTLRLLKSQRIENQNKKKKKNLKKCRNKRMEIIKSATIGKKSIWTHNFNLK